MLQLIFAQHPNKAGIYLTLQNAFIFFLACTRIYSVRLHLSLEQAFETAFEKKTLDSEAQEEHSLTLSCVDPKHTVTHLNIPHAHSKWCLFNLDENLGRFPFVRSDWPDHSRRNENFTFNQNCPARYVTS